MASGILGKFLTGVAEVAVPAAFEQQRAEILRMRDERLQSFQKEMQTQAQEYQTAERVAGQEFASRNDEFEQNIARDSLDVERDRLALNEREVSARIRNLDTELEGIELSVEEAKKYKDLRQQVLDAPDDATRNESYRNLLMFSEKWTAPDPDDALAGLSIEKLEQKDDLGNVISQELVIVDKAAGTMKKVELVEGARVPDVEDINLLNEKNSPEYRKMFDDYFGQPGLADQILAEAGAESGGAPASTGILSGSMTAPEGENEPETVAAAELTPEQIESAKKLRESVGYRGGQNARAAMRWALDEAGSVVEIPLSYMTVGAKSSYRLLNGFVRGVGNFVNGVLEGEGEQ